MAHGAFLSPLSDKQIMRSKLTSENSHQCFSRLVIWLRNGSDLSKCQMAMAACLTSVPIRHSYETKHTTDLPDEYYKSISDV